MTVIIIYKGHLLDPITFTVKEDPGVAEDKFLMLKLIDDSTLYINMDEIFSFRVKP
jgi:hypothetical protein